MHFVDGRQFSAIFGMKIKKVSIGIFKYFFILIQFCESQNLICQIKKKNLLPTHLTYSFSGVHERKA